MSDLRITKMERNGDGWTANVNGHPFYRMGSVWVANVNGKTREALVFVADALNRRQRQALGLRVSAQVTIPVPKKKRIIDADTGRDLPAVGLVEQLYAEDQNA